MKSANVAVVIDPCSSLLAQRKLKNTQFIGKRKMEKRIKYYDV